MKMKEEVGAEGKKGSRKKRFEPEGRRGAWGKRRSLRNRDKQLDLYEAFIDYLSLNYVKLKMKVDSESVEKVKV